jgi:type VI protein secretion system component VasF
MIQGHNLTPLSHGARKRRPPRTHLAVWLSFMLLLALIVTLWRLRAPGLILARKLSEPLVRLPS